MKGKIIVFLGSDGSGKTTLLNATYQTIKKNGVKVKKMYFGSGRGGNSSILRWPLKVIATLRKNVHQNKAGEHKINKNKNKTVITWWALTLARERKKKLKKAQKYRSKGYTVLCDRFPQSENHNINDGPMLQSLVEESGKLMKKLALWEFNVYMLTEKIRPNLVFVLSVDPEIAHKRKSDISLKKIIEKQERINSIRFQETVRVCRLNTERSIDDSVNYILKSISALSHETEDVS